MTCPCILSLLHLSHTTSHTTSPQPHNTHGPFFAVGRQLYLQSVIGPQHFTVPSELNRGVGRTLPYAAAQPEVPRASWVGWISYLWYGRSVQAHVTLEQSFTYQVDVAVQSVTVAVHAVAVHAVAVHAETVEVQAVTVVAEMTVLTTVTGLTISTATTMIIWHSYLEFHHHRRLHLHHHY